MDVTPNRSRVPVQIRSYQPLLLAGTFLCVLVVLPLPSIQADDQPSFVHVVQQHYSHWTNGGSRPLSAELVSSLVTSPKIHGAEAAALASIHCYQRKSGQQAKPATLQYLTETRMEDPSLRRDQAASGANFSLNFQGFLNHIQSAPRKVLTAENISLDGISQGHLGDCYYLAGIGAAVHQDPSRIRRLLHPQDDGACDVHFPDGRRVHVPPLTDAQLALGSSAGKQGTWLNVLEVAGGIVEEQTRKERNASPLDLLGEGGDSIFTIQLLTAHRAAKELIRPHVKGSRPAPADHDVPRIAAQVEQQIRDGLARKHLICCGVGEWSVPPGMGKWHQYAILGCDRGMVHIWNPWGSHYHFEPKGTPGLQHGYVTQHGRFYMPIQDFVRVYGAVNVETHERIQ